MPFDIFSPVTAAALVLPVVYFLIVGRKWPKFAAISLALYIVVYVVLSISGAYTVANHGGSDWTRQWRPKFLIAEYTAPSGRTRVRLTVAGAVYWPCILVYQLAWHRTENVEWHEG